MPGKMLLQKNKLQMFVINFNITKYFLNTFETLHYTSDGYRNIGKIVLPFMTFMFSNKKFILIEIIIPF